MTRFEQDALFVKMAHVYAESVGQQALCECAALPSAPHTPRLDARVRRRTVGATPALLRWVPGVAAVAAGLLLAVFVSQFDFAPPSGKSASLASEAASSPALSAPSQADVGENLVGGAVLPLAFSLPDTLAVSAVDTDRGQTVYHLASALRDDVVLTLEEAELAANFGGLHAVYLDGRAVYGVAAEGYNLLTFETDGVVYTMTCRYDMRTLTELAEAILL